MGAQMCKRHVDVNALHWHQRPRINISLIAVRERDAANTFVASIASFPRKLNAMKGLPKMRLRIADLALALTLAGSLVACETTPTSVGSAQNAPPLNSDAAQAPDNCGSGAGFDADINHFPLTAWPENSFIDPCWPR
jgi:hypothetical protein